MKKGYRTLQAFLSKKVKIVGMVSLSVLAIMLLQAAVVSAASSPQTTTTYYACVNNTSGALTIVSSTTKCATGYHKIHWNQQGPTGPQGVQGPQGAQGPQGPQGPSGVSQGYTGSYGEVNFDPNEQFNDVVATNPVAAGTYIITASETAQINTNDIVMCAIGSLNNGVDGHFYGYYGPASQQQFSTITVTDTMTVSASDQIILYCADTNGDPNSYSINASISAIQVTSVQSNVIQHNNQKPSLPKLPSPHK